MTTVAPAYWPPGREVLRRFRRPDSLAEGVQPCRVVRDDEKGLVLWLAPGTPVLRAVLADGRDIRDVPLSQRFDYYRHGRATRLDTWRGQGILGVAPPDVPWSVWLSWTEEWEFQGGTWQRRRTTADPTGALSTSPWCRKRSTHRTGCRSAR